MKGSGEMGRRGVLLKKDIVSKMFHVIYFIFYEHSNLADLL